MRAVSATTRDLLAFSCNAIVIAKAIVAAAHALTLSILTISASYLDVAAIEKANVY